MSAEQIEILKTKFAEHMQENGYSDIETILVCQKNDSTFFAILDNGDYLELLLFAVMTTAKRSEFIAKIMSEAYGREISPRVNEELVCCTLREAEEHIQFDELVTKETIRQFLNQSSYNPTVIFVTPEDTIFTGKKTDSNIVRFDPKILNSKIDELANR